MIEFITSLLFFLVFLVIMGLQLKQQLKKAKEDDAQKKPNQNSIITPGESPFENPLNEMFEGEPDESFFEPESARNECPHCHKNFLKMKVTNMSFGQVHELECRKCGWKEIY